jgi:NADPH:quinone reductase-like Zn-dependent oxidoreductase
MRAAVIEERGATPVMRDFPEPAPKDGAVLIDMDTVGLGGWDTLGAYRMGVEFPCVIRAEGIGRAQDGRRVYFGERAIAPFGAWAERAIVPAAEVWDVPDGVDDKTAITMGIAGTGALIPLEWTKIQKGDSVLVLGATGTIGQLGLQLARILGAGRVVGASRNEAALSRLKERKIADATVRMGTADDVAALKAEAGEGFDVVLDLVCGAPFLAALKATRWGARIATVGTGAGREVNVNAGDLLFRSWSVVGTGQRPPADRCNIWKRLLGMAREHNITVDYADFKFDEAAKAWELQKSGAHAKITAKVRG